jgi:hypothetical protein
MSQNSIGLEKCYSNGINVFMICNGKFYFKIYLVIYNVKVHFTVKNESFSSTYRYFLDSVDSFQFKILT